MGITKIKLKRSFSNGNANVLWALQTGNMTLSYGEPLWFNNSFYGTPNLFVGDESGVPSFIGPYKAGTAMKINSDITSEELGRIDFDAPIEDAVIIEKVVQDYDGNWYDGVVINNRIWTMQNLRTTHYSDGTAILNGENSTSDSTPYYYNDDTSSIPLNLRGYFYNWPAIMNGSDSTELSPSGVQGIAPLGWHIPSAAEWDEMTDYVKSVPTYLYSNEANAIGKALAYKQYWTTSYVANSIGWNQSYNNKLKFGAVPAGYGYKSSLSGTGEQSIFWTATEYNTADAYVRNLNYQLKTVGGGHFNKYYGMFVRCVCNKTFTEWLQDNRMNLYLKKTDNGPVWASLSTVSKTGSYNDLSDKPYREVTYSELKNLVFNSKLEKGAQYRITDYALKTPTTSTALRSANHQFDIIVIANSENTIDENARATLHAGDTYFADSNLDAWDIKYSLDNHDAEQSSVKYDWCNSSCKGVIYYMKDEWGNECGYDFKNLQFSRKITDGEYDNTNGIATWVYTFTAFKTDDNYSVHDASMLTDTTYASNSVIYYRNCSFNKVGSYFERGKIIMSSALFLNKYSDSTVFECRNNTVGDSCMGIFFGNNSSNNTVSSGCTFITTGNNCRNNHFELMSFGIYLGNDCINNRFGQYSNNCHIGSSFQCNTIGHNVSVTFGDNCKGNSVGNRSLNVASRYLSFGDNCTGNSVGNDCEIDMGSNCTNNTFESGCKNIKIGNYIDSCIFERCENVRFGHYEYSGGTSTYVPGSYYRFITVKSGVSNIYLYDSDTADSSHWLQNIYIAQGIVAQNINTITRNCSYRTTVAKASDGTLRIYNEDDEVQLPTFANVATSGSYNDLVDTPSIPDAQIQSDWEQTTTTAKDYIKNKPSLATVATSGSYNDLSDTPDIGGTANAALYEEITYANLVTKVSNSQLVKGKQYRITDYVATTSKQDSQTANKPFDIIVIADSANTLNENARAALHSGDTYFASSNLNGWKLKYCISNDTSRFDWADTSNGKGVVYYMKDEFGNECPYDFKGLKFLNNANISQSGITEDLHISVGTFYYTFTVLSGTNYTTVSDHSLNGKYCFGNRVGEYVKTDTTRKWYLPRNLFLAFSATGNCYANVLGTNCHDFIFGAGCISNKSGDNCFGNFFASNCKYNTFGNDCYANKMDSGCNYNVFGDTCVLNYLGFNSNNNTFGSICVSVSMGSYCSGNMLLSCDIITFNDYCSNNKLGLGVTNIDFGHYCSQNTIGNYCTYIKFGNSQYYHDYFKNVKIENGNSYIYLYSDGDGGSESSYLQNVYVAQGCSGTSSSNRTFITTITRNRSYRTTVGRNSSGSIRIYNEDDAVSALSADTKYGASLSLSFDDGYTAVTDTTGKNPKNEGWFERSGTAPDYVYTLTTDTTPASGKTYYSAGTCIITAQLKDQDGNNLGSAQIVDLPLESVVVDGSYDSTNKKVVLTLKNGGTVDFSVADLISGLQETLVSGTNIKTINGNSLLGSGDIDTSQVAVCTYNSANSTMNGLTFEQMKNALNSNKVVVCEANNSTYYLSNISTTIATFVKIRNPHATNPQVDYIITDNSGSTWTSGTHDLQLKLVGSGSGQNIKTVNGNSLLGSGDIAIDQDYERVMTLSADTDMSTILNNTTCNNANLLLQITADTVIDMDTYANHETYVVVQNTDNNAHTIKFDYSDDSIAAFIGSGEYIAGNNALQVTVPTNAHVMISMRVMDGDAVLFKVERVRLHMNPVTEAELSDDDVAIVLLDNNTGTLKYITVDDLQQYNPDLSGYTIKPFVRFTRGKNGKSVVMHKTATGSQWALNNYYKVYCDTTAAGGFTITVGNWNTSTSATVSWSAGATLDSIVAQMTNGSYCWFSHESGEDFIRVSAYTSNSSYTCTLTNNIGGTVEDLSIYCRVNGVVQSEVHRVWQGTDVSSLFPSFGFLPVNSAQYAKNGYNMSWMCCANLARCKTYYGTNGASSYVAESSVAARMTAAAFAALNNSGVAEQQALYDKYDGSWDAYMDASMIQIDDTHTGGIEYQSYDNGEQSKLLASVETKDFTGNWVPAYPAAYNAAQLVDANIGACNLPTNHEIAVFMEDSKFAKINTAISYIGGNALSNTGYYWSVAQYYSYSAWLYSGYSGTLDDTGKYYTISVRALAYLS